MSTIEAILLIAVSVAELALLGRFVLVHRCNPAAQFEEIVQFLVPSRRPSRLAPRPDLERQEHEALSPEFIRWAYDTGELNHLPTCPECGFLRRGIKTEIDRPWGRKAIEALEKRSDDRMAANRDALRGRMLGYETLKAKQTDLIKQALDSIANTEPQKRELTEPTRDRRDILMAERAAAATEAQ